MQIGAMAYDLLTPEAKAEAIRLLRLNPQYDEWIAGCPADPVQRDRYLFIKAAVWADDVKILPTFRQVSSDVDDKASGPLAGRNIGYTDLLIHGYWHFRDIPFSPDGTVPPHADSVDAVTQIKVFKIALPKSSGKSDQIRSYDLAWLLHIVGDVHQPLHSTVMFTKELSQKWKSENKPDQGDRGGNEIFVRPANGERVNLHAYFDSMFGDYSTVFGAIFDAYGPDGKLDLPAADPTKAAISNPDMWLQESHQLAIEFAYAEPVLSGRDGTVNLTREYETRAREMAKKQLSLAAARLANLINGAFK